MEHSMADSQPPPNPQVQLQLQLDDTVAAGQYANLALINHNDAEFTLDFVYVQPQQPRGRVHSRIITSPRHMKRLLAAIQDNVDRYEARFGTIQLDPMEVTPQWKI
jgi:hypothetical protein